MNSHQICYGNNFMSIKSIHCAKTTTTIKDGITYSSNPATFIAITSDGRVFNNRSGRFLKPTVKGLYGVYFTNGNVNSSPASFDSIVSYMFGVIKGKRETFALIDESKGYVMGNVKAVPRKTEWKTRGPTTRYKELPTSVKKVSPLVHLVENATIELSGYTLKVYDADHKFITEDNVTFSNKADAIAHQLMVDKGKEAANLIVTAKCGYLLAKQIFQQFVTNDQELYTNFKDMLANNAGIVEVGANPTYKFINQADLGEYKDILLDRTFTEDEAHKTAELLRTISTSSSNLLAILCE